MKRCTVAVVLIAFAVTPAFADNEKGHYQGAGVGQFKVEIDDVDDVMSTVEFSEVDDANAL